MTSICPICSKKKLHKYYYVYSYEKKRISGEDFIGNGGLWNWCSSCKHYEHFSSAIPSWWIGKTESLDIDEKKLKSKPEEIERALKEKNIKTGISKR